MCVCVCASIIIMSLGSGFYSLAKRIAETDWMQLVSPYALAVHLTCYLYNLIVPETPAAGDNQVSLC